jgi:outer membrane protein assembly factor BamB
MFRKDPVHSGYSSEETSLKPPLQLLWKSSGAPGAPNSAVASDGKVFVEFAGVLFAHDAKTGVPLWLKPTPVSDHASVVVGYGMVFDGSGQHPSCTNCGIVAHDIETGEEKWRLNVPPKGVRGPSLDNGVLYFGSEDHYVRAANAYTGKLLWTSPPLNNGVVAVPAVADGRVFVGTWGGLLYALNSTNGQILWQSYTGGVTFSSPSVVNNTVYVGSGTENVYAFDAPTGTLKWTYTGGKDSVWGSPAIAYGNLYVQDLSGHVHALDINNGNLLWLYRTLATGNTSISSPAVANGVVYIGSQDKNIYALDAYTGDVLWKYQTGGAVHSSPAISNGMLYVSSNDGYIYAFGNESAFLNVPDIKQYSPPWNDDVYDDATSWSTNPTIERWGCALTSTSMVLKYFGHNINPDDLNNWLNSQPDGYLRSGLLNWLAVSRYTRINQDADSPILEYRRFGSDQTILENELIAGNPAILKLPGHFVVAKGKTGSDFDINDPATTRNLLSSYGESYLALNRYRATPTDLSYIMFAIDSDITLQLLDSEGNPVEESYFLDEPLVDDIDGNQTSGEELRIFLLPTPTQGNYTLEAAGSGTYQLDSYLYSREGDVRTHSFNGILQEGQIDEFLVTIGETSGAQPVVTINTIIEDLNNSWNQGLIRKESIYSFLLRQLQLTKKFIDMNRTTLAKIHLRVILTHIKLFTPKFIQQSASNALQTDIQSLANTL